MVVTAVLQTQNFINVARFLCSFHSLCKSPYSPYDFQFHADHIPDFLRRPVLRVVRAPGWFDVVCGCLLGYSFENRVDNFASFP